MIFSTAHSKEFELVDIKSKPSNDGKLKCDNCENCAVTAVEKNSVDEIKYFCIIMHTITWSTTDQTMIKVCSKQQPIPEAMAPSQVQQTTQSSEPRNIDISDSPDFEPDTKPFSTNI